MPPRKPAVSEIQLAANRANAARSTGPALRHRAHRPQAILRAARLETGLFTSCLSEVLDSTGDSMILMNPVLAGDDIEITLAQNRNWLLGEGFRRCVDQSNSWSLFIRYQAQAERHYRRAVEEFERLKALRHELPNKPNFDPNPNQTQPLTPPENEPISASNPGVGSEGGGPPGRPPPLDNGSSRGAYFAQLPKIGRGRNWPPLGACD